MYRLRTTFYFTLLYFSHGCMILAHNASNKNNSGYFANGYDNVSAIFNVYSILTHYNYTTLWLVLSRMF